MTGAFPSDLLQQIVSKGGGQIQPSIAGSTILLGSDGRWLARRARRPLVDELIVTTSKEVLQAALSDVPVSYDLDLRSPLSVVVDRRLFRQFGVQPNAGLDAVQSVRVKVLPGLTALDVRMVIGNVPEAQRLAPDLREAMSALAKRVAADDGAEVRVVTTVEDGDVVSKIDLPSHVLDALVSRIASHHVRVQTPAVANAH